MRITKALISLRLCCSQTTKDRFSRKEAHIIIRFLTNMQVHCPHQCRVGIKPGFYHKAQPGRFYGFYEGGFLEFYGFYVGFINLKVYH